MVVPSQAVVYEALLLLQEFCLNRGRENVEPAEAVALSTDDKAPVRSFVQAISRTDLFTTPSHIVLCDTYRQQEELRRFINENSNYQHLRDYCEELLDGTETPI